MFIVKIFFTSHQYMRLSPTILEVGEGWAAVNECLVLPCLCARLLLYPSNSPYLKPQFFSKSTLTILSPKLLWGSE